MASAPPRVISLAEEYHWASQDTHANILVYQSFIDLLHQLKLTLQTDQPYIDLPQKEVLNLVLTAVAASRHSCTEPGVTKSIVGGPARRRPVNWLAAEYLRSLLALAKEVRSNPLHSTETGLYELERLRAALRDLFGFLSPDSVSVGHRNASMTPASSSLTKGSSDLANSSLLNYLSRHQWMTRTELFGNSNFDRLGRDPWDYFLWPFKCAIKGLTEANRPYRVSWTVWHDVCSLIIGFYEMEWSILAQTGKRFSSRELLMPDTSLFFTNVVQLGRGDLDDGFLELVKVALVSDLSTLETIKPILHSDLTVKQAKYVADLPNIQDRESRLGLQSIPIRRQLLVLGYAYTRLLKGKAYRDKYLKVVTDNLLKTSLCDFRHFFSQISGKKRTKKFVVTLAWAIFNRITRWLATDYDSLVEAIADLLEREWPSKEFGDQMAVLVQFLSRSDPVLRKNKRLVRTRILPALQRTAWWRHYLRNCRPAVVST